MDIKVKSLFLKSSPRKVRPVLYGLRGKTLEAAMIELKFTNKKGARLMFDLVKSGFAAAKENDLDTDKVFIKSINCTEGPRLKRRLIGSRGRAKPILKRMCHLNLTVTDVAIEKTKEDKKDDKNIDDVKAINKEKSEIKTKSKE